MATNNQKEVDLIIRAKDLSTKVLEDTEKAINEVTSSLKTQVDAAGKAETSMKDLAGQAKLLSSTEKDLTKTAATLEKAVNSTADSLQKASDKQDALQRTLDTLNESVVRNAEQTRNAGLAYQIFSNDILAVGPPTKKTAAELAKLSTVAEGGGKDIQALTSKIALTKASLGEAQGNVSRLSDGLKTLQGLAVSVAAAQDKVTQSLKDQAAAADRAATATAALSARQATIAAGRQQRTDREAQAAARQADIDARNAANLAARQSSSTAATGRSTGPSARQSSSAANLAASVATRQANSKAIRDEQSARDSNNTSMTTESSLLDKLTTGNRESLSWYQRVRGELIALATAYVGLQGALGLAGSALDAVKAKQAVLSQLAVAAGSNDPKAVGEEYAYISGQADRLGLNLTEAASSYAKFAVAAKAAGATTNQTRFLFEGVATAAKTLNLSTEDTTGVFLALEQMLSKGQIQAEELRGQLGDRLPGALADFAKSTHRSLPQLAADLKAGNVQVKDLLPFAQELSDKYGKQLPTAVNNLQSAQNRLTNATDAFKRSIADDGFQKSYTDFISNLTTMLQGDPGKQFAQGLSDGFSAALTVAQALITNIGAVKDIVELTFGVKVLASVGGFITNMLSLNTALKQQAIAAAAAAEANAANNVQMTEAEVAAAALQKQISAVNKIFLGLSVFLAGWQIGDILSQKFEVVRLAGTAAAESIEQGWNDVVYGVQLGGAKIAEFLIDTFESAGKAIGNLKNGFLGALSASADKIGLTDLSKSIASGITTGVDTGTSAAKKKVLADIADIQTAKQKADAVTKAKYDALYKQDLNLTPAKLAAGGPAGATALTDNTGGLADNTGLPKKDKGAEQRLNAEQSLMEQLNNLYKQEDKNLKTSLGAQLDAVDKNFTDIQLALKKYQRIGGTTVGGESIATIQARVAALKDQAELDAEQKFDTEELARQEQAVNDVIKERADFEAQVNAQVKAGVITAAAGFKQISDNNAKVVPQLQEMAKNAGLFADSVRGEGIPDTKIDAFIQKMNAQGAVPDSGPASDNATAGLKLYGDELSSLNDTLAQRNALVQTYNNLVQLGVTDQATANDNIKQAYQDTAPAINTQIQQMQALLTSLNEQGDIAPQKFKALSASLQEVTAQSQYVDQAWAKFRTTFTQALSSGAVQEVDNLTDSILAAVSGTESWSTAFKNILTSFGQFISKFLQQMADAILQIYATKLALAALGAATGSPAGSAAGGVSVGGAIPIANIVETSINHGGGVIGRPGGMRRAAPSAWFAGAPRYHSGTVVGLASDEQAAILQKGEEVLSKDNPRNIMNVAASNSAAAAKNTGPTSIRNVLVTDPNFVPDAIATPQGEQTIITMIARNRVGFKQALGVK